jgi:predicted dehydrogenase
VKALVLGLGGIGQRHVRNLRRLLGDGVEFTAHRVRHNAAVLTDSLDVESAQGLEQKYRIRTVPSLEAGLADDPDIVLVCNPSSMHVAAATAAAGAGCHVFIEKPLADGWDGVENLIATVDSAKTVALVAYQWRFHPLLQRVRERLAASSLGRILAVRAESGDYLPGWHPYEDYRQMYAARRDQGGGVILAQIHEMDYLYWLFGRPNRIVAMGGRRSSLELDVEDTASILMDFGGLPVHVQLDYLQRPPRRTLQIVGESGTILADLLAPRLQVYRDGMLIEDADFAGFTRSDMFIAEMRHFLRCVAGEDEPVVSVRDGSHSLAMALAARQSLATGHVVALA